jgi:hypothetical protein
MPLHAPDNLCGFCFVYAIYCFIWRILDLVTINLPVVSFAPVVFAGWGTTAAATPADGLRG